MKFISLIDTHTQNVITIDADALILRIEIDEHPKEARLKPFHADILYSLFSKHPVMLSYKEINTLLKRHNLIIADDTRMHRKLSEIRNFLSTFHPSLEDLILNTRGNGYSLPLKIKKLDHLKEKQIIEYKNTQITKNIVKIEVLIDAAISLTAKSKVIKKTYGYVINRDSIRTNLVNNIKIFNSCEQTLLTEIRIHEADLISIRVQYLLAKLRTYIGLARISEYPLSEIQWLDWFQQEAWVLFDDLKKLLKLAESL